MPQFDFLRKKSGKSLLCWIRGIFVNLKFPKIHAKHDFVIKFGKPKESMKTISRVHFRIFQIWMKNPKIHPRYNFHVIVGITNLELHLKNTRIMFRVNFGILEHHKDSRNPAYLWFPRFLSEKVKLRLKNEKFAESFLIRIPESSLFVIFGKISNLCPKIENSRNSS